MFGALFAYAKLVKCVHSKTTDNASKYTVHVCFKATKAKEITLLLSARGHFKLVSLLLYFFFTLW